MKDEKLKHAGVQFITHYTDRYTYLDSAHMALEGGCRWIQLRMKDTPSEAILPVARQVQALCRQYGATFIIDDHVELVRQLQADGVHLGLKDMPIADARLLLGPHYLIGGTANTFDDVQRHHASGADYIGCGPFRYTTTKRNLSPILGLEGYRDIVRRMHEAGIHLPIVAIGGITAADIPLVLQTGVSGIALSGTVLGAPNPVEEMKRVMNLNKQV